MQFFTPADIKIRAKNTTDGAVFVGGNKLMPGETDDLDLDRLNGPSCDRATQNGVKALCLVIHGTCYALDEIDDVPVGVGSIDEDEDVEEPVEDVEEGEDEDVEEPVEEDEEGEDEDVEEGEDEDFDDLFDELEDDEDEDLSENTVEELRDMLRERDLKVGGTKDELIARLEDHDVN